MIYTLSTANIFGAFYFDHEFFGVAEKWVPTPRWSGEITWTSWTSWRVVWLKKTASFFLGQKWTSQKIRPTVKNSNEISCANWPEFVSLLPISILSSWISLYHVLPCFTNVLGSCCFLSRLPWSCLRSVCRGEVCIKDINYIIFPLDHCLL